MHNDVPRQFARGAALYFVVVGIVGVLLRARYVAPVWRALRFDNLVHAHSHVAYFGWAALALMAAIYAVLPRLTGRPLRGARVMRWQLGLTHVVTVGALVTFATGGYTPLSIVFSTLNVVLWYIFIWLYAQNVKGTPRPLPVPLRYLHGAVALLFVSSLGTWFISAVTALGGDSMLGQQIGLNIFLTNYTDGWLLLGLLGIGAAALTPGYGAEHIGSADTESDGPPRGSRLSSGRMSESGAASDPAPDSAVPTGARSGQWAAGPLPWIVVLTPLTFLAQLVPFEVSAGFLVIGLAARFALAVPYMWYIWNAVTVYRARGPRRHGDGIGFRVRKGNERSVGARERRLRAFFIAALGFFVVKAIIHAGLGLAAVVPSRQIFVSYLHLDLLGFVSCGLIAAIYFAFVGHRAEGRSEAENESAFDPGVAGAVILSVGVVGMVAVLAVVGAIGGTTDSALRAVANGLLQAAFVFGVVSLIGIVLSVMSLLKHVPRA